MTFPISQRDSRASCIELMIHLLDDLFRRPNSPHSTMATMECPVGAGQPMLLEFAAPAIGRSRHLYLINRERGLRYDSV
jgi:hypothetical protein